MSDEDYDDGYNPIDCPYCGWTFDHREAKVTFHPGTNSSVWDIVCLNCKQTMTVSCNDDDESRDYFDVIKKEE